MTGPLVSSLLLLLHGLVAVALLGGVTHQFVASLASRKAGGAGFLQRYSRVSPPLFTAVIAGLYVANTLLGGILYPAYRLGVRVPLEELRLIWVVGLFELKEHFAAIGLGILPLYVAAWRAPAPAGASGGMAAGLAAGRPGLAGAIAFIVWFDFLCGHYINNLRGLT